MLFSVNYQSSHKMEADEIKCPAKKLGYILSIIKDYPTKRYVIIDEPDGKTTEQVAMMKNMGATNVTIESNNVEVVRALIECGSPAFLRYPISDWELFMSLKEIGVSDIYIDGPLIFQKDKLVLGHGDVNIRVSPTISPNASVTKNGRNITSAFIRPEDLPLYEGAIQVIDFQEPNQEKEDALFSIYKRQSFNFDLSTIVTGLRKEDNINNLLIPGDFCDGRLNCGQACKVPGPYTCRKCNTIVSIAQKGSALLDLYNKDN